MQNEDTIFYFADEEKELKKKNIIYKKSQLLIHSVIKSDIDTIKSLERFIKIFNDNIINYCMELLFPYINDPFFGGACPNHYFIDLNGYLQIENQFIKIEISKRIEIINYFISINKQGSKFNQIWSKLYLFKNINIIEKFLNFISDKRNLFYNILIKNVKTEENEEIIKYSLYNNENNDYDFIKNIIYESFKNNTFSIYLPILE